MGDIKAFLRVRRWLNPGAFNPRQDLTSADIIRTAGTILDRHCTGEIFERAVFQAHNGRHYRVVVEARIEQISASAAEELAGAGV
jgi:hypothetical protein